MTLALVIEVGIFYLLAALGGGGELASAVELIWLCIAVALTAVFVDP
ncbi:MAG: hypothetical protein JSU06_05660 [Actinobacteria bacterium]|nr:hypothetical protein [Actinomycetota bacterium]